MGWLLGYGAVGGVAAAYSAPKKTDRMLAFTLKRLRSSMKYQAALLPTLAASLLLSGCVSTAKTVVTAPFKAAGQVVDWTTTSQEEADRNRGRAMRERDAKIGKLDKQQQKALRRCERGDRDQCQRAQILDHEIEALMARPI